MLRRLGGRSTLERAKTVAIALLLSLFGLSVWQLMNERSELIRDQQNRLVAMDAARRFGIALTTYDYAHLGIEDSQIAAVSSEAVRDRVLAATLDLTAAKASSIGEVTESLLAAITATQAEVLVRTSQLVTSTYAGIGVKIAGLLDVRVSAAGQRWVVTDYRWLLAPSAVP